MKTIATICCLTLCLSVGAAPQDEKKLREKVEQLIEVLSEDSIVAREEAGDELLNLGPKVLPILKSITADDEEVAERLRTIIATLEKNQRLEKAVGKPTLISLNAKDRPLGEVFKVLADRSGIPIHYKKVAGEKVTVSFEKLPFWKVKDSSFSA